MASRTEGNAAWTVMVYMAGDNNLEPNGVEDLREMKTVGSSAEVNVLAQFDRGSDLGAVRYYLRKGGSANKDAVAKLGRTNTGDPKALLDFIRWAIKGYPAERYLLVLWNHGQGWDDTDIYANERYRRYRRLASGPVRHALFHTPVRRALTNATKRPRERAILLDDDAKDFLDNIETKKVLSATKKLLGRKLDVLGMDACLMSMAEVTYQMRSSVEYSVGSEQTEPLEGWPYDKVLAALVKKPSMTAAQLSKQIVSLYAASYRSDQVTQSACELAKLEPVAKAVRALATYLKQALKTPRQADAIILARARVQRYDVEDNVDLVHFCKLLANNQLLGAGCKRVAETVRDCVSATARKGNLVQNSNGMAIYFPTQSVSPLYAKLDFSRKTGWDTFLNAYVKAARG